MNSQKDSNIDLCPHCGAENTRTAEFWIHCMDDGESIVCGHCKKLLYDNGSADYSDSKNAGEPNYYKRFLIIACLLSGLFIYLNRTFDALSFGADSGQIVYGIVLVLFISSMLASGKIWQKLKYLAIWAGIILILMTGYSYRYELSALREKVLAELIPAKGFRQTQGSVSFPVSSDGHFYIQAEVNGVKVIFLADTGASHIVLSPGDAVKLGIEKAELNFDRFYETANGTVRASSIRIADFRIGAIQLKDIGASVNEAEMRDSLLGMTFFKRLKSYEVKDDVLTLHWNR